jgi:hypothetical protein
MYGRYLVHLEVLYLSGRALVSLQADRLPLKSPIPCFSRLIYRQVPTEMVFRGNQSVVGVTPTRARKPRMWQIVLLNRTWRYRRLL